MFFKSVSIPWRQKAKFIHKFISTISKIINNFNIFHLSRRSSAEPRSQTFQMQKKKFLLTSQTSQISSRSCPQIFHAFTAAILTKKERKKRSGTVNFPSLSLLNWYVPSGCKEGLFLYGQMKLQTSLHNYFKKHPVLNNIALWRKLHAGKQQHIPHMALLFLLEVFISSPEPVSHKIVKNVSFCSRWWNIRTAEKSCYRDRSEHLCVSNVPGPH